MPKPTKSLDDTIRRGVKIMPLVEGEKAKTKSGFSTNVKREIEAGKSRDQAAAIAYSESGEHKDRHHGAGRG